MSFEFHIPSNNAVTKLKRNLLPHELLAEVENVSLFPEEGKFWVTIGDEIVEVDHIEGDYYLFLSERGSQNTPIKWHETADLVELRYTAEQITELQTAINSFSSEAELPVGVSNNVLIYDGSSWVSSDEIFGGQYE